ncbi:primary-amine oxidase [Bradyrhizobium sp. U87765 SZCCT0131]|uniref:primary-amine oxidase n=1 Tax=unclassified Bradyrhizobium TaxID=2631580 RepID=UPI001BA463BC|nr:MULTISPECIES: primary-amine oxidase [unclassified Bradyrhizobium]MBR1217710.1 primary-amine oxidase [Bradyrhizobium sp. U87765 SZCCT0131]MBR1261344.1 primary-amine oxidase [Bradyrhizobium sp. U87765 SZCCT0134]MBR1303208.1 primary-amine oxidase [Bradyrhizobium sp. U87765 SZCCT0110]MBR1318814.1 primary-amine oxidase [Bradyrhizobium sp. U87765 SZCCT0109]MBR1347139.1 primary-amine oxidase [Bradyrhizobium sp. U87765 SZCCT0048]
MSQTDTCACAPAAEKALGVGHPLDPLSLQEIELATSLLTASQKLGPETRFAMVHLAEPTKAELAAHAGGAALARRAFLLVLDARTGAAHEAVVDLTAGAVSQWARLPNDAAPYGQPPVMLEEFARCEQIVKADEGWRRAMRRRGLTDADMELAQIDPFSSGFFGRDVEKGRRIVRAVSYYRSHLKDNGYAHPIEGVVAVVDLVANRVTDLVDDEVVVPIPRKNRDYNRESISETRTDIKPLHIVQPEGASFTVDGWEVSWQRWNFRVGFTPREGLVLHQLSYDDKGRKRSIVHRASVTEMVVPYADPTANHYWKSAFDAGEYGLGKLANALELGCDCLGHIRYFDIPAADDLGRPFVMKNAVCMHEEDYGILWKHYEFRNDTYEVRRSRRLVISFFATVGNYDYGFYWYLYQDGTIQLEAKLTGIIQTAAVAPGATYPWGGMVDDGLGGPTHQHFFNVRLHMDVDGGGNSVTEHEFVPRPWGKDNPYGNVFDTTSRTLQRERDAARIADGATGRYWKVVNPNQKNSVGKPTGYKLIVQPSPLMLAQEGSTVRHRGGFATRHVWVTRHDPAEKYASGDYPNVHAGGDGLPRYIQQNRDIDNQDIVLWHSFGHTHVCKPEDFPVMPVEYAGFMLKPNGFFDANPAMDLPAERNARSVDGRDANGHCCS